MGPGAGRVDIDRYDRFPGLTPIEERMLTRYAEAYRFYRYGRTMDFGTELGTKIGSFAEPMEIERPFIVKAELPNITDGVPAEWAHLCRR